MVRPIEDDCFEIGAGHRRSRAARAAGLTEVPCYVVPMTDEEFLNVLNFDNSGHENVHPLHEAAGWRGWLEKTGQGVVDIAARVGKSVAYVYQRLKYADLIPAAQKAFIEERINSRHAILIARLDPPEQALALKACEPPSWAPEETVSERALAAWIKKNLHILLEDAPFDSESAELLPSAGPCATCSYRLGNAPDFNPAEDIADVCTRPACYQEKIQAHIEVTKQRLGDTLVLISQERGAGLPGVLEPGDWFSAAPIDPAAKQALIVHGPRAGTLVRVRVQERIPAAAPAQPAPAAPKPKKAKPSPEEKEQAEKKRRDEEQQRQDEAAKLKRQREESEAKLAAEKAARRAIVEAILPKVKWPPRREEVAPLLNALVREFPQLLDDAVKAQGVDPRGRFEDFTGLSEDRLARLVFLAFVARDCEDYALGRGMELLKSAAKRYGVDPLKIRAELEGGTRREVIAKLPAANASAKKAPAAKAGKAAVKKSAPVKKAAAKKGGKK